MTNITLNGTAAVNLQQGTAAGFSLQNNGPGNVYLANDASVSPSTGFTIQPGMSLPLNDNSVLYGCTDNGKTASVQLLQGATASLSTIVEANVPNAVNANITNPAITVNGAVNANITNASIPVSGNVDITAGNVTVNGTVGVDVEGTFLFQSNLIGVPGGNSTIFDTSTTVPVIDPRPYQSMHFGIVAGSTYGSPATAVSSLTINQFASTIQISSKTYYFLGTGSIDIDFDVLGDRVQVIMYNALVTGTLYSFYVTGDRAAVDPKCILQPMTGPFAPWFPSTMTAGVQTHFDGYTGFDASTNTAGVSTIYLPSVTGENYSYAELVNATSGSGWALEYFENPISNAGRIQNYNATAPYTTNPPTPVYLRPYPIILSCAGTTASGNRLIYSLTSRRVI